MNRGKQERGERRGRNWPRVGRMMLLPNKVFWLLITVWALGEANPGRGGKEEAGSSPRDNKRDEEGARELSCGCGSRLAPCSGRGRAVPQGRADGVPQPVNRRQSPLWLLPGRLP